MASPLNLVDKAGNPGKYRLIHNLAFPYDETSINACIPDSQSKVKYQKFDVAILLGLKHGCTSHAAKVDFDSAFCNFPVILEQLPALGFSLDGKFYVNSSMALGARSSCKIFEEFASAIQWCLEERMQSKDISHYLDDFIMIHALKDTCCSYMVEMKNLCRYIGAPLSEKKMEGPVQVIAFLGLLIDFRRQVVTIPEEKVTKALLLIQEALGSQYSTDKNKKGKVTVRLLQRVTGVLNFFCKAIPSRHPFLRRLYNLQTKAIPSHIRNKPSLKPNPKFKIRLDHHTKKDLNMWIQFLNNPSFKIHREIPFLHFIKHEAGPILYADASGNPLLGFGCVWPSEGEWAAACWPVGFFQEKQPDIILLELYAIVIAVDLWAHH